MLNCCILLVFVLYNMFVSLVFVWLYFVLVLYCPCTYVCCFVFICMCVVLSHSTMEERLVRMVEFKIIDQSINQSINQSI